jgi:hypothetical protein
MKKIILLMCFIVTIYTTTKASDGKDSSKVILGHKNLIKINLPTLALRTYALEYERAIGRKTALSFGYRFMPNGTIPQKDRVNEAIDDPEITRQINAFETSNSAFTPQIKFYFGKDIFKGFYISPFARIAKYSFDGIYEFDVNNATQNIPLAGELNTITGGLELGVQFRIGKAVHLNFNVGPQFGSAKGDFAGIKSLNTQEQQELRNQLEDLEIPFADTEVNVNGNGVNLNLSGPWAGLKAGIMFGIRF